MDTASRHRYDRKLTKRMWDRAARHWLALGALGGLFTLHSCSNRGALNKESPQACGIDADCAGITPICDQERRVCVECTRNDECAENEICTTANTCRMVIPCVSRTECPTDLVCDQEAGFCVDCVGDNDCDEGEICDSDSQCRTGCDSDKDCQNEGLLCALDEGVCVACVEHIDCATDEYCRRGSCVPDSCQPGHQECAGDELLTCSESGSGFNSETCADGCTGAPGAASCVSESKESTSSASGGSGGQTSAVDRTTSQGESGGKGGSTGGASSASGGNGGSGGDPSGSGGASTDAAGGGGSGGSGGSTECGAALRIPVTYRDFNASHSDFDPGYESDGVSGVVDQHLSDDGKPVLVGESNPDANIASQESFAQWYTDGANRATIEGELVLYDDGAGGFVNRWGPNGEPWIAYREVSQCGVEGDGCAGCEIASGRTCMDPCPQWWGTGSCSARAEELDGNPLFFPIDGDPNLLSDPPQPARIPPAYGPDGWVLESDYLGNDALHNFLFTTEIHIEFAYDASRTQRFSFLGDDDLWVFLNGQLIIDLGGWHEPLSGEFSLDASTAESYDLVDGEMYEIAVFQAERQPEGSSFMMRLEGFGTDCN